MKRIIPLVILMIVACSGDDTDTTPPPFQLSDYLNLNWNQLPEYRNISYPAHYSGPVLQNVNTPANNPIINAGAILGRVLFYDKELSINNNVSCASCHQQSIGFSDNAVFSTGVNGITEAHSMRLLNLQFYTANSMFWDKRANSLEIQSTQPIKDHIEMGFSVHNGGFSALITKLNSLPYYPYLFEQVFGTTEITEDRIQKALSQFMRSIVSIRSKYDTGHAAVFLPQTTGGNVGAPFPNYTEEENAGKQLFLLPKPQGGFGCAGCHVPPTFSLAANSLSNGLDAGETKVFKSPSLKNISNGPFMHDGRFATLDQVIEHYNTGILNGPALDNRLKGPNNQPQQLNMTAQQKAQLKAFLLTLTDETVISDSKFSSPFYP